MLITSKITRKMSFGWRKGFMVAEVAEEDFEKVVKKVVKKVEYIDILFNINRHKNIIIG